MSQSRPAAYQRLAELLIGARVAMALSLRSGGLVRDKHPQLLQQGKALVFATLGVSVVALAAASLWGAPGRAAQLVTRPLFGVQETSGQWVNIGPAPNLRGTPPAAASGRVASIAVDPTNPSHWLLGVGNGGVWETRDTGRTWAPIADDAPTLATGAVAFAPSNPNIIYVGTGEGIQVIFSHSGVGILKSTDGGRGWTLLGASAFSRVAVKRLRVHPTNPDIVLAASSRGGDGRDGGGAIRGRAPSGIWKSTDGGVTWARNLGGLATALEIDAGNFNNQYAAIGEKASPGSTDPPGSSPNGIYRSSDGGDTWSPVAGPWGVSTRANPVVGRIELAMAPSNPNIVYAGIVRYGSDGLLGLYRTDDAFSGTPTWIQVPTRQAHDDYCSSTGPGSIELKCGYSHVLTVDPGDPNRLFAGGRTLWRCTSCAGSPTWTNVHFFGADYHATAWAGNRLIAGNDYGVQSTTTFGTPTSAWQNHNVGLSTGMFYKGALHPSDPGFIVGGFRDFSTVVQRDGSPTWRAVGGGGEGEIAISTSRPTTDWMMSFRYIRRTTDGGQTITPADAGIDWSGSAFVAPVRKCPSDDNFFLAGTTRIWRTADFFSSTAPSWAPNSPSGAAIQSIAYVADDATCNSYAYGTRDSAQVFMTRNGGSTWTDLDPRRVLQQPRSVNWLAFEPGNPSVLYAAIGGFDDDSPTQPGHVFKATNVGPNVVWTNISPPSNTPFNVVAVDPRNVQRVYAGSDLGLWHSNDGGANWIKDGLDVGLPNASVYDIQINPTTNRTVIFTYGRGAYVLTP